MVFQAEVCMTRSALKWIVSSNCKVINVKSCGQAAIKFIFNLYLNQKLVIETRETIKSLNKRNIIYNGQVAHGNER